MADHFWDEEAGSFFMTSDGHEALIIRPKSNYDLSIPSGNSVAAQAMLRLFHLSHEQRFMDIVTRITESQAQAAAENPFAFGHLLNTIATCLEKPVEITIINTEDSELCRSVLGEYVPNSIIVTVRDADQLSGLSGYPFFAGKSFGGKTSAFVCKDFACSLALHTADEIKARL